MKVVTVICKNCLLAHNNVTGRLQKRTFRTLTRSVSKFLSKLIKDDVQKTVQLSRFLYSSSGGLRQQVKEKEWDYTLPQVEVPVELFRGMDTDFPCLSRK